MSVVIQSSCSLLSERRGLDVNVGEVERLGIVGIILKLDSTRTGGRGLESWREH